MLSTFCGLDCVLTKWLRILYFHLNAILSHCFPHSAWKEPCVQILKVLKRSSDNYFRSSSGISSFRKASRNKYFFRHAFWDSSWDPSSNSSSDSFYKFPGNASNGVSSELAPGNSWALQSFYLLHFPQWLLLNFSQRLSQGFLQIYFDLFVYWFLHLVL